MRWAVLMVPGTAMLLASCGGPAADPAADGAASDAPAATSSAPAPAAAPAAAPQAAAETVTLASLTADAARGERAFAQCRACHSVDPGRNMVGPSLHGVVGREAGSVPNYAYSAANRDSHLVWDRETLFTYLESPMRAMPGTKMTYMMRDAQQRADVIAYLETLK